MVPIKNFPVHSLLLFILLAILASCSPSPLQASPPEPISTPTPTPVTLPTGVGGGVIVFASDRDRGRMDIYLINADGSELTQLTHTRDDEIAPSWSPDGSKIAYLVSRHGQLKLAILNLEFALTDSGTDHPTFLVEDPLDSSSPSWSPDGNTVFYTANKNDNLDLYKINVDGSSKKQLTQTDHHEKHPTLSPDGTKLVYCSNQSGSFDLYLVENFAPQVFQNQLQIQLTSGDGDELFPVWSPDGTRILYTSTENGNKDLAIIHLDGSNPSTIANTPADEWNASWSPDGAQIVYSFFNFNNTLNDLYIYEFENNRSYPITSDNFDNWWPAWRP